MLLLLARCVVGSLSYEKMVRKQFGSPEAIQALAILYGRVEKEGAALKAAGAKSCAIPASWIPKEFSKDWACYFDDPNQVVAYFDDKGGLAAVEFDGTRCGVFISRDPGCCPASFHSLYRLSDKPLYITARVDDDE